ncbi:universal stress protein [Cucumibacter marinus]|uniref:universal stress protein n=1 Tax=Cucumibacter marinus TaxID=1121252 RepID=UPI00048E48DE|nr:universal stress protein [Cucumibacter marinus]
MPKKILVATDGSETGGRALAFASEISSKIGGDLTIVHVLMHGKPAEDLTRLAQVEHVIDTKVRPIIPNELNMPVDLRKILSHPEVDQARAVAEIGDYVIHNARRAAEEAGARNVQTMLEDGDYADAILDVASDLGVDLIVMGRRGLGRISSVVLGSVSNKVLQHADCDVAVVR